MDPLSTTLSRQYLRQRGCLHEWYHDPQDPFLVAIEAVGSVEIEHLAGNYSTLVQENEPRHPCLISRDIYMMEERTIFFDKMGELTIMNHKELIEPGHTQYAGSY